jgi:CRP/FNR family cyclic AMP-dependent transcriptional regulator
MPDKETIVAFDPKVFLSRVGTGKVNAEFRAHDVIFAQGDVAETVFYLQKGKVKVAVTSKSGKEAVLGIFGPDNFFGEGCLNGQTQRMTTVTAMTDCSVTRLDRAAMMHALHDEPEFSNLFIDYLLHRNSRVEEDLIDQLFNSSEKRLARILLLLADFGKDGMPETVIPKISQETLAEMVGTTRSRVNTFMNKFRRLGYIDYSSGGLEVHSSLLNVVLHD